MSSEILSAIKSLTEGANLTQQQAGRVFQIMMLGAATPAQMAALLVALRMKGETPAEIAGAASAMRAKMEHVHAPHGVIDVCGTGGDSKGTFNVSTAVALVVAACGVPVAKHGNRSVSSSSGSADVLASLGVNIQAEKAVMEKALQECGIAFLFAPLYHKAMRHVAPVRQELGIRTVFNILGPLVNPAKPLRQVVGVYHRKLMRPMAEVLQLLGLEQAWVVHGQDGMDELTTTGASRVIELKDGMLRELEVQPEDADLPEASLEDLQGGGPQENARELLALLNGKISAYRHIVQLNAAAALIVAGKVQTLTEGAVKAAEVLDNGKASDTLNALIRITEQR